KMEKVMAALPDEPLILSIELDVDTLSEVRGECVGNDDRSPLSHSNCEFVCQRGIAQQPLAEKLVQALILRQCIPLQQPTVEEFTDDSAEALQIDVDVQHLERLSCCLLLSECHEHFK